MRIALLQINTTAGDLAGNSALILAGARRGADCGADLTVTPELALMGYLPRDLLMNGGFVKQADELLGGMAAELAKLPPVLVGTATPNPSDIGRPLFNSAVLISGGKIGPAFHKTLLPTYDVFDEDRYFEPAGGPMVLEMEGQRLGISVCEDVWNDRDFWQRRRYHRDPIEGLADAGVELIVNLSASPFVARKQALRERMLGYAAAKYRLPILYANLVGGNDDLIFDGRSCAVGPDGLLLARAKAFEEDLLVIDTDPMAGTVAADDLQPEAEIWSALVLGVRDYVRKTGFSSVLLGLSGGIDSSLTAAIAAEAIGADNVLGVLMPSPYSSAGSVDDSLELARNLGIRTITLPIQGIMEGFARTLAQPFTGYERDVTEENIQARIRGNLLMALSNKYRSLLLTTGNKSEISVGYCTLYGDMSGGLAVIADLPKTLVYAVSRWRNRRSGVIPESVLTKAPSAELRPDQKDQDTLPPYDLLDEILRMHIEDSQPAEAIIAKGYEEATVRRTLRMVKGAEFKRKQGAPGLKVTSRAFGTGWRMPIATMGH
ncbi:MAG: NAD+ synthase, partial [Acidobacteria bacterium]|nr:NAD+ synthase [Acidobacteriota bacterium]